MKWDDLVLNFEWSCDLKKFMDSKDLKPEQQAEIEAAMKTHKQLFDHSVIAEWLKGSETSESQA